MNKKKEKLISAYSESIEAGFCGTFEQWKKQYPKIVEFVLRKEITKEEFAQQEAKRTGVRVEMILKKWEIDAKIKAEKNLRKVAIGRVQRMISGSGSVPEKEQLERWIQEEIEVLRKEQEKLS